MVFVGGLWEFELQIRTKTTRFENNVWCNNANNKTIGFVLIEDTFTIAFD